MRHQHVHRAVLGSRTSLSFSDLLTSATVVARLAAAVDFVGHENGYPSNVANPQTSDLFSVFQHRALGAI